MNELELLHQLLLCKKQLQDSILDFNYAHNVEQQQKALNDRSENEHKIELVTDELLTIKDKSYSSEARVALIRQLRSYITEINKAKPELKLTRNQGMILKNMLFGYISKDIYNLITDKVFGIHIPAYLIYSYSNENTIEISVLTDFLKKEIDILSAIKEPNYIILHEYYEGFKNRVSKEFLS